MSEVENTRRAALREAEEGPVIQVEVKPEAVVVHQTVDMTVRFLSRSRDNIRALVPVDVGVPVVELVGEPGAGEDRISFLERIDKGVYQCRLSPTVPGTHAYKIKKSVDTDLGELVEVEVLDEHMQGRLREFFQKLISGTR